MSDIRNRMFEYVMGKLMDLAVALGAAALAWFVIEYVVEALK